MENHEARGQESNGSSETLGVPIPDEHVGTFVAEAFEDVERSTTWEEVVEALVADEARSGWEQLSPIEQVVEVLSAAADYDERAIELLADIPTDRREPTDDVRRQFEEARRCRRNADIFRDGIAAAYSDEHVDDDQLIEAVTSFGFETNCIAERENELERVAKVYEFDFRPYGGTLMDEMEGDDSDDWEAW